MTKTQIQVPEPQMARIREFARQREWSLAETFRRGVELLMDSYGPGEAAKVEEWEFPTYGGGEWQGLDDEAVRELIFESQGRMEG